MEEARSKGNSDFRPIVVKIVSVSRVHGEGSNPYCVCEVAGKPNTHFRTEVSVDTGGPHCKYQWNHVARIPEFLLEDALEFTVFEADRDGLPKCYLKDQRSESDEFIGTASLGGSCVTEDGFRGELQLIDPQVYPGDVASTRIPPVLLVEVCFERLASMQGATVPLESQSLPAQVNDQFDATLTDSVAVRSLWRELGALHGRFEAQEERIRSMRSILDSREDSRRSVDRISASSLDARLEELRQVEAEGRREIQERVERLAVEAQHLQQAQDGLRKLVASRVDSPLRALSLFGGSLPPPLPSLGVPSQERVEASGDQRNSSGSAALQVATPVESRRCVDSLDLAQKVAELEAFARSRFQDLECHCGDLEAVLHARLGAHEEQMFELLGSHGLFVMEREAPRAEESAFNGSKSGIFMQAAPVGSFGARIGGTTIQERLLLDFEAALAESFAEGEAEEPQPLDCESGDFEAWLRERFAKLSDGARERHAELLQLHQTQRTDIETMVSQRLADCQECLLGVRKECFHRIETAEAAVDVVKQLFVGHEDRKRHGDIQEHMRRHEEVVAAHDKLEAMFVAHCEEVAARNVEFESRLEEFHQVFQDRLKRHIDDQSDRLRAQWEGMSAMHQDLAQRLEDLLHRVQTQEQAQRRRRHTPEHLFDSASSPVTPRALTTRAYAGMPQESSHQVASPPDYSEMKRRCDVLSQMLLDERLRTQRDELRKDLDPWPWRTAWEDHEPRGQTRRSPPLAHDGGSSMDSPSWRRGLAELREELLSLRCELGLAVSGGVGPEDPRARTPATQASQLAQRAAMDSSQSIAATEQLRRELHEGLRVVRQELTVIAAEQLASSELSVRGLNETRRELWDFRAELRRLADASATITPGACVDSIRQKPPASVPDRRHCLRRQLLRSPLRPTSDNIAGWQAALVEEAWSHLLDQRVLQEKASLSVNTPPIAVRQVGVE